MDKSNKTALESACNEFQLTTPTVDMRAIRPAVALYLKLLSMEAREKIEDSERICEFLDQKAEELRALGR